MTRLLLATAALGLLAVLAEPERRDLMGHDLPPRPERSSGGAGVPYTGGWVCLAGPTYAGTTVGSVTYTITGSTSTSAYGGAGGGLSACTHYTHPASQEDDR